MAKNKKKVAKGSNNKNGKNGVYVVAVIVVAVGLIGGYALSSFRSHSVAKVDYASVDPSSLRGGETRPVLSPANFVGQTARVYRIAQEIPEVLDSMYCYCQCERNIGHKSLLSCYTGDHASYCDICQNQALRTYELYKKGMSIVDIRKTIDREFGG